MRPTRNQKKYVWKLWIPFLFCVWIEIIIKKKNIFRSSAILFCYVSRFSVEAENSLNNIHYRIVPPSRYEDVVRLLYGSFFTDEPMSKCLGLTDGIRRDPSNWNFITQPCKKSWGRILSQSWNELLPCWVYKGHSLGNLLLARFKPEWKYCAWKVFISQDKNMLGLYWK